MYTDRSGNDRLDKVLEFCRTCICGDASVEFDPERSLGGGQIKNVNGRIVARIGTKRRLDGMPWSKKEYLEFCVTAGHELRHLEQRGLAKFTGKIGAMSVEKDVCISYWACVRNQCWYELWNTKSALCEIDAEYVGLIYGEHMASICCKIINTEKAVVAYCNKKVNEGFKAERKYKDTLKQPVVGYYLKKADCAFKSLRSWDDIDAAFDKAEERVKENQPMYKAVYFRTDIYPFGDEFFDIMRRGRTVDDDCFDKFVQANRIFDVDSGCSLVNAMACLAVYLHPEDTEKSPVDLSGLTAESLFGSPFSETPEEMIAYRNYVCAHEIDIVNLGKPLNRYGDGPVERNVDFGRSGRQFGESECSHEDVSNQDDALDLVDLFGSGTSRSGALDELHAGLEAKALTDARKKAAEMAGLEYQGSDEIKEVLAKPGLPDFSEKPSDVKKDGVER